jgi:EF-P beta-lysylation protein EpmB
MDNWQKNSREGFYNISEFNQFLNSKAGVESDFSLKISKNFANLIDKNNPNDPILKQFLPTVLEDDDFDLSPLEDEKNMPISGLIHKYKNRVLLIASHHCFAHCRYCFRRNFNYNHNDALGNLAEIQKYLQQQKGVDEVILSGGDPLSLNDDKLKILITAITQISHIKTLRIHSRNLVVLPSRITDEFVKILKENRLKIVIVFHINHANEMSKAFVESLEKLKNKNITLLNQSVLLKGVNDNASTLINLSQKLFAIGILPYYLHLLDKVKGSKQFFISEQQALKIYKEMQENLSGYLVPKLVQDKGEATKTLI